MPRVRVGVRVDGDPKTVDDVLKSVDEALAKHGLKAGAEERKPNQTYGEQLVRREYTTG